MHPASLAAALRADGTAFAEAASRATEDLAVPSCPEWTLSGLVRHLGSVYRVVTHWVCEGHRPIRWDSVPQGVPLLDWYQDGLRELLDVLDPRYAAQPCATWCSWDRTLGFWLRRMAHETAVHRVDAQLAVGASTPLGEALATDGIDEVLTLWLGAHQPPRADTGGRPVMIRAGGRDWTIALHANVVDFCDGVEPATVISGEAEAVSLWLWGRADEESVNIAGDLHLAKAVRAAVAGVTG